MIRGVEINFGNLYDLPLTKLSISPTAKYQLHTMVGFVFRDRFTNKVWKIIDYCQDKDGFTITNLTEQHEIVFSNGSRIKSQFRTIFVKPFI